MRIKMLGKAFSFLLKPLKEVSESSFEVQLRN